MTIDSCQFLVVSFIVSFCKMLYSMPKAIWVIINKMPKYILFRNLGESINGFANY